MTQANGKAATEQIQADSRQNWNNMAHDVAFNNVIVHVFKYVQNEINKQNCMTLQFNLFAL